ncbi:MAG: BMC domain-containing protein [Deltaproteobacteria bacterium]|nr:BMC domain-containing protein [Deltaproteobacteria bacterium]
MSDVAHRSTLEAVAVVETASIARGFVVLDAIAKRAPVTVRRAAPVSPGKLVIVFGGELEATRESHHVALELAGSGLVDELLLPGAHPMLLPAMDAVVEPAPGDAVGIVETATVATAVHAADVALKAVTVAVPRMHLAVGVGGKGWFTVAGALADVEAALGAVKGAVREDRIVAIELIAQPHGEIRGFLS